MSVEERRRLVVLSRVKEAELSLVRAAELLGISYRQVKRLWARYQSQGDAGVVHGLRGRASNRQAAVGLRERVLDLYREKYSDYGPTLAAECLAADDGVLVPVNTLRRWLTQAGVWQRRRKRKVHRRRRDRREQRGELVQMDGSHHDWFEGRREWAVLMVMIDDATGTVELRQDGVLIQRATGIVTDRFDYHQWYVGNLVAEGTLDPPDSVLYVDDVTITEP